TIKNNPCIRCGRCVDNCPMKLSPAEIQVAFEHSDVDALKQLGAANCIECGSCTYVCPAKRSITQMMRLSKAEIRKAASK
ncbi:MAG: 4Fe-4S dicluster domain-containing protein, partial [Oscillospiraceae bacterium]